MSEVYELIQMFGNLREVRLRSQCARVKKHMCAEDVKASASLTWPGVSTKGSKSHQSVTKRPKTRT